MLSINVPNFSICIRYGNSKGNTKVEYQVVWGGRSQSRLLVQNFKSYLSFHSFHEKCENELSTSHTSSCCVSQCSVLGPLLLMYTTPLHSLISSLSLKHHLYADNTQLFFSFHPPDFDSSITSPTGFSSANLFLDDRKSFNSKLLQAEFLLIKLKKHFLSK